MMVEGEGGGIAGRSAGGGGYGGMAGSTENSLLDVVFLPELSLLLGLVGGRAEVRVQSIVYYSIASMLCVAFFPLE